MRAIRILALLHSRQTTGHVDDQRAKEKLYKRINVALLILFAYLSCCSQVSHRAHLLHIRMTETLVSRWKYVAKYCIFKIHVYVHNYYFFQ